MEYKQRSSAGVEQLIEVWLSFGEICLLYIFFVVNIRVLLLDSYLAAVIYDLFRSFIYK